MSEEEKDKEKDKAIQEYLEASQELWEAENSEETQRQIEKEKTDKDNALKELEELFADRGLIFYNRHGGYVPMQIYGEIDGLKFYWRTRGNTSSIKLGPYSPEVDAENIRKEKERKKEQYEEHKKECDEDRCLMCFLLTDNESLYNDPKRYYPPVITKFSSVYPLVEGDVYKGDLEANEIGPIFKILMTTLRDVKEGEELY